MNENITRISDLPDSYNMQPQQNDLGLQNSYIPMNIHPTPYGNGGSPQNTQQPPLPLPFPNADSSQINAEQKRMIEQMPNQRLPSRDIKIEPIQIYQDEHTRPNYIPADDLSNDFVLEYEKNNDKKLKKHEQEKHRTRLIDRIFTEIQTPILIAIMFFIFQMPLINRIFFKYFVFLNVYDSDGQMNIYGMLFKSVLFGLFYYSVMMSSEFISEL